MRHPSPRLASLAVLAALLVPAAGLGDPPCPEWLPLMSAEEYWHHSMVVKNLRTESETDQFFCVVRQLDEEQDRHRVDKRSLLDLGVKEAVLRRGVERTVDFLRRRRKYLENDPSDLRDWHFKTLERLTGVKLDSIQEWSDWFDANHERLRLSPDGERLIVSSDAGELL